MFTLLTYPYERLNLNPPLPSLYITFTNNLHWIDILISVIKNKIKRSNQEDYMQRSAIVKSLSLASVVLSLMGIGAPSALAATTTPAVNQTASTAPVKPTTPPADYGDIHKTLVPLAGTVNTRDLGGYTTADGKWQVRSHSLLRSDQLVGLTTEDIQKLTTDFKITSVIDLRTPGQVKGKPDKALPGAKNTNISVLGPHAYTDSGSDGEFYNQRLAFGHPAVVGYHKFLNMVLANPQATLYHCTSGKDRTGIATVLLLSIMGVSRNTIIADYMQSNQVGKKVERAWLMEYYKEVLQNYGSMEAYITECLEFSPAQQEQLRAKLLVSTDGKNTPYPAAQKPVVPGNNTGNSGNGGAGNVTNDNHQNDSSANQTGVTNPPNNVTSNGQVVQPSKPTNSTSGTHKPGKKKVVKIVSTKKMRTTYKYQLKGNKVWFKDAHLQKTKGHTPKHSKKKWQLVKQEKVKINGKAATYFQVKDRAGHRAWLVKSAILNFK